MTAPHIPQIRAMLAFERSLVDRVGPPGCAARETAAANVAALEWVLGVVDVRGCDAWRDTPVTVGNPSGIPDWLEARWDGVNRDPALDQRRPRGSPDAWDRSRPRGSRLTRDKASPPVTKP